jgi:hypothetical protein
MADPARAIVRRCSPHPAGNGRSSFSTITRWSAHPPRIASTMSGASSASRRIRLL